MSDFARTSVGAARNGWGQVAARPLGDVDPDDGEVAAFKGEDIGAIHGRGRLRAISVRIWAEAAEKDGNLGNHGDG